MTDEPQPLRILAGRRWTRAELVELVREEVAVQLAELGAAYMDAIAELRDELHEEIVGLDRRLTEVHEKALRALTDSIQQRGKG